VCISSVRLIITSLSATSRKSATISGPLSPRHGSSSGCG
jgi:hypothetical protein